MSFFGEIQEKLKHVKVTEWAVLLIALGLAGALIFSSGTNLFSGGGESPVSEPTSDELETRLASVLSCIEGAGKVEVVIYYAQAVQAQSNGWLNTTQTQADTGGEPAGVVVVAEGAGDLQVRIELARAVQTLLRLDADAVEIFKMEGGRGEE